MTPTPKQVSAVASALKALKSPLFGKVIEAAGDEALAHAALWSLVKAGRVDVSKNWMQALAFEGCPGKLSWKELLAFLAPLPENLVSPGGGKQGYGFFLLAHPTYQPVDVPRALASLAVRAAADDRDEASKPDDPALPEVIRLVLDYGRGAAGLPLSPEARARVLQGLARAVVKHGLVPEAWLKGADGKAALTSLENADPFVLAQPFGTKREWLEALRAALLEQVARAETDRYNYKGIPHLECVEAAFPLLSAEELVAVLSIGAGSMDFRPWETIARAALARLDAAQLEKAKEVASLQDDLRARQNAGALQRLLAA